MSPQLEGFTGREMRAQNNLVDAEEAQHICCETLLKAVKNNPSMYAAPRLKYLREFMSYVECNPGAFRVDDDTDTVQVAPAEQTDSHQPTLEDIIKASVSRKRSPIYTPRQQAIVIEQVNRFNARLLSSRRLADATESDDYSATKNEG